jgi:hypothetical protein
MTWRERAAGRLPVLVAGLYCAVTTVVPVGWAPGAPALAQRLTWLSLLSLPLGLLAPSPGLALLLGVGGVIGGAIGTFAAALWAGRTIEATPLGVLGFFALALAWGALSSPAAQHGVGQGARTEWLTPRRSIARFQVLATSTLVLALPLLLLPPLSLQEDGAATFALVAALGLILLCLPRVAELSTRFWLRRL